MKKIFTLICALVGLTYTANAAGVDAIKKCNHSYVLVGDDYTGFGTGTRTKGTLFGGGFFLDVTGGSVATNKGSVDLSVADGVLVTEEIAAKYGSYGSHLNSLRLKKAQDVIAFIPTGKSKIIIFYQDNNKDDRYPVFCKDAALKEKWGEGVKSERVNSCKRIEWTVPAEADQQVVYVGDNNGDMFLSYFIVEAKEAPGSPSVSVSAMAFDEVKKLYFKEVSCVANDAIEEGETEGVKTVVTYTTDGSAPTAESPKYTTPIKCYEPTTVKFQAFYDWEGDGTIGELAEGADPEASVEFMFLAPAITVDGATVTISNEYQNSKNYYSYGSNKDIEGDGFTADQSYSVSAYTKIDNGTVTFTSLTKSVDVLLIENIDKTLDNVQTITLEGSAVLDEEATAEAKKTNSEAEDVYKVEGGKVNFDVKAFFVSNPKIVAIAKSEYQIDGQQAYLQLANATDNTITLQVKDTVNVEIVCSKNSCKSLTSGEANALNCKVVATNAALNNKGQWASDATFGNDDITAENGNIITFGLPAGKHTIKRTGTTGNLYIASLKVTPVDRTTTGITDVKAATKAENAVMYNIAGQKVSDGFKGLVIKNGKKVVLK